jgi:predicted RNA binding protein YcfA (HicA-like mRNA interferase family)
MATAIVPYHREIAVGTIRSILRQAGITTDQWEAL